MKIGIDASRYGHDSPTGVEWYSTHLIDALIPHFQKPDADELVLYSPKRLKVDHGYRIHNRILPGKRLWTLWHFTRELFSKKSRPDVLFVPSHTLPLVQALRTVITIHDVAFRHLREAYSIREYLYLEWSTRYAVARADQLIVPSEATAKDLVHFFGCPQEKIRVIHHGFTAPRYSHSELQQVHATSDAFRYLGIHPGMSYILFVGRLEAKKNLARLVRAFAEFSRNRPEFYLILAGKRGVGFEEIMKAAREEQIGHKVIMPGYVTEAEKAALYHHAHVVAFPSLYEGFGLPLLEAFHYKKPVLCSHVSSLPEIGGEAVHYIDPYDVESIELGLEKTSDDEEYRALLVSRGTARLAQFSWEEAARNTLAVLYG